MLWKTQLKVTSLHTTKTSGGWCSGLCHPEGASKRFLNFSRYELGSSGVNKLNLVKRDFKYETVGTSSQS